MSQDANNIIDMPQLSSENVAEKFSSEPENADDKVKISENADEKVNIPEIANEKLEIFEDIHESRYNMNKTQILLVFVGLSLAIFLAALDQTIVATALPAIALDFKALDEISWVGTAYLLTATAFQPTYGALSDIFGRKPVFLSAIFLFEFGSLLCGLSVNMTMLIISRAVAGLGIFFTRREINKIISGGGLIGLVLIIISEIVPIKDRGKYQGMIGGCFGIASVVGPLLGGAFTDSVITFISVIFLLHLPSPTGSFWSKLARIDWWGALTLVSATILVLLPLNWGGSKYEWSDPIIISLLCLGGVGYILFIFVEARIAEQPIAPPTTSGLELLPLILGVVVMAISSGQLVSRTVFFSYGSLCILGSILMAVGSGLISTFALDTSKGQIIGYCIIAGVGIGMIIQVTVLAGQGIAEPKDIATVTSLLAFFRTMGAVFGVAIMGTVFNNVFNANLPSQYRGSLQNFGSSTTGSGKAPEFILTAFVSALDTSFKVVIIFAGLSLISSIPLITVKPHRDNFTKPSLPEI
ncbi:2510_t:CDS:10 [Cetraspora pellucida]|uniref:2510_t:CDS:1 n=1 Tax=Cetraspora pellucida TaxID=1433469 RepID=A0A9N8VID6_9GLOM|nr:2510_t:CDS:10 [Cetraspora pellucida]